MYKNSNITVNFFMIMFMITMLSPLQACGDGSKFSSGEVTGSENEKVKEYELGSFEVDGLEGDLEGNKISFSSSELTNGLTIIERGSVGGNEIYDSDDWGLVFSIFKEEKISLNIAINAYRSFEANQVYEFGFEEFGNVTLDYYFNDGSSDSSTIKTVRVVFSKPPTSAGNLVSGELEVTTNHNDKIVMSFSANAVSKEISFY
ncbi:MAG: hypothetical protein ABII18_09750 [bacterium]|nr:hypothetical protein [bacterium]